MRKAIRKEQRDPEGLTAYIAWMDANDGKGTEYLTSNFLPDKEARTITIKQLERMEAEGWLVRDWTDWVVKR